MNPSEIWLAMGVPSDAVVSSSAGRLVSIDPPQPWLITKIVAAGIAGELDGPDVLRSVRSKLLSMTDYTQLQDSPLNDEQRAAWATYRQALRDLPQVYGGDGPIPWPTAP